MPALDTGKGSSSMDALCVVIWGAGWWDRAGGTELTDEKLHLHPPTLIVTSVKLLHKIY